MKVKKSVSYVVRKKLGYLFKITVKPNHRLFLSLEIVVKHLYFLPFEKTENQKSGSRYYENCTQKQRLPFGSIVWLAFCFSISRSSFQKLN